MILNTIRQFIERQQLLSLGDKVLVALSGGSDSVALLLILRKLGYDCIAAHCNFQLRGEESERDETFVRDLCRIHQVPLQVVRFDTKQYAALHHLSIEMAARNLRYDWFETVRKECGANVIAVAHHQDDSAETILLNLIRGTGIHGLCGIRSRNGYIIRPLLCVSRQEILDYLHSLNQTYVTDSTNLQDEYTRNKIRLRLLPLMEEINPSVKESLQKTGFYLSEVDKVYGKVIEEGKKRVMQGDEILISALLKEPSPFALLFEILHPKGFNSSQIMEIYQAVDGQSGKVFTTPDYRVVKDRDRFIVQPISAEDNKPPFELTYHDNDYTPDFVIPRESRFACLDRDKLPGKLVLRKWKEGDSFVPFGMKGRKLVSDFLTDLKLSVIQKEQQWLLCSDEQIVWVVGKRIDNRFRVDGSTKKIVLVEMIEKKII